MKRRVARLLAPVPAVLAILTALAACSLPPYNEDLSLGMLTAAKMDGLAVVGPLYPDSWNLQGFDLSFLPSKDALINGEPLRGYLTAVGQYNVRVYSVRYGTNHYIEYDYVQGIDNTDPDQFSLATTVAKVSDYLYAFLFEDDRRFFAALSLLPPGPVGLPLPLDPGDQWNLRDLIEAHFPPVVAPTIIGAAVIPDSSPAEDRVLILWRDEAVGDYHEAQYRTDPGNGLMLDSELRAGILSGLPSGIDRGFYGHHPTSGNSYLSYYDGSQGRYRTFRWGAAMTATELTGIKHRVDAVLSNGRLFSYGETRGYVYDSAGREVNSFPLGGLRLAYELTVGTPRLIFSLPSWGTNKEQNDFLVILMYSIPTSAIDSL